MREEHGIQCMACFSQIISEMLPEIHTVIKCYFLTYNSSSYTLTLCYKSFLVLIIVVFKLLQVTFMGVKRTTLHDCHRSESRGLQAVRFTTFDFEQKLLNE